jgi:hypothetical protein
MSYIVKIGGVQGFVQSYSVGGMNRVDGDSVLAMLKNLTLYFSVVGAIAASYIAAISGRKRYWLIYIVFVVFCGMFTKRTYILMALFPLLSLVFQNRLNIDLKRAVFGGLAVIFIFLMMYIYRESSAESYGGVVGLINSPEFWIYDQMIYVAANYQTLNIFSWPFERYISSLLFWMHSYAETESIGVLLNNQIFGTHRWGVPPSIMGYLVDSNAYLFPFLLIVVFLPLFLFIVKLEGSGGGIYRHCALSLSYIFFWELLRLGDPLIAILHVNRYMFICTTLLVMVYVINKMKRAPV